MRKALNNITLAFVFLFVIFQSCNRDVCEKSCSGCLELYQPFVATVECTHIYIDDEDNVDIRIMVKEIIDQRTTGDYCNHIGPGEARIVFDFEVNGTHIVDTLKVPGCLSGVLSSPYSTQLYRVDIGENYKYKLLKLYPLSGLLFDEPFPIQEDYDILGVITKN